MRNRIRPYPKAHHHLVAQVAAGREPLVKLFGGGPRVSALSAAIQELVEAPVPSSRRIHDPPNHILIMLLAQRFKPFLNSLCGPRYERVQGVEPGLERFPLILWHGQPGPGAARRDEENDAHRRALVLLHRL